MLSAIIHATASASVSSKFSITSGTSDTADNTDNQPKKTLHGVAPRREDFPFYHVEESQFMTFISKWEIYISDGHTE